MIKHGVSHAAVSLVSVIGGEMLTRYVLESLPSSGELLIVLLSGLASQGIHLSPGLLALLLTVSGLSFVWGVIFKSMTSEN